MSIVVLGVSHKCASLSLREQLVIGPESVNAALRALTIERGLSEAVILSTCNRTEIYTVVSCEEDLDELRSWFCQRSGWSLNQLNRLGYLYQGIEAVRHLLRVASGLDSLVLGEPQILGQLKLAYATARSAKTTGSRLSKLFQFAFKSAKYVRSQTQIGESPVSVAYAAVSLSKRIFSSLSQVSVLLVGAGQTAQLLARHFKAAGVREIVFANRTLDRAHSVAQQVGGRSIVLQEIPEHLPEVDILVSSTASPLPIIGKGMMEAAIRSRRHNPVLAIDLAVPRDIEPAVGELEDVFLYSVDDLESVISDNVRRRQIAAQAAEQLVQVQANKFQALLRELEAVLSIRCYREKIDYLCDLELQRALKALSRGESPEAVLSRFARSLRNKVAHEPTVQMRKVAAEGEKEQLKVAQRLLGLSQQSRSAVMQEFSGNQESEPLAKTEKLLLEPKEPKQSKQKVPQPIQQPDLNPSVDSDNRLIARFYKDKWLS